MMRKLLQLWPALGLALALLPGIATAASIETLMMPGELIDGHAKYEKDCSNCHERFSKTSQDKLCLDCHKKVAADVRERRGFHGRIGTGTDIACKQCHTEHHGRKADIVRLDKETFDHSRTDFPLKGAHGIVRCASCHEPGKKFREAPAQCSVCHKKDNPHKKEMGDSCADCHNERAWTRTAFDHDKTDFPLKGKHRETSCNSCHPNERYKNIAKECNACHRLNDVHQGRYGAKCQDCHAEKKWKDLHFDHNRDTKYELTGKHKEVRCDSCHTGDLYRQKLSSDCVECHRNDDDHKGQFGKKCVDCHNTGGWTKPAFDHDKDTKYPLRGRHRDLKCNHCHGGNIFTEKLSTVCFSCHKKDDPHKEQQGKQCERCHDEKGWSERIMFDHDVTHFPLIGAHAVAPCEECHLTAKFKDTAADCHSCHEQDDEHKGRLGDGCGLCHNPNGWRYWIFDHDKQTDFKIDGAHKKIGCYACHISPVREVKLPGDCGSCHQRDDVHGGGFGARCERCHDTEAFTHIRVGGRGMNR